MARPGLVSTKAVAQRARADWDRAIAAIAAGQHGIVTHGQLIAIGFSSSAIRARVAAGRLYRLHRGVYAVGFPPFRREAHWLAAVLACGERALLSHRAAGALLDIRESAAALIDVSSPTRAGRRRAGIRVHRADNLRDAERTVVNSVPCTTVARTIVDLAGVLTIGSLEYTIHRAQTKRRFPRDEVIAILDRLPRKSGTANVRQILGLSRPAEDRLNSELERRLFRICALAGVPQPEVNRWIALPAADGGGYEVDFCWPERRLIVETDSRVFHETDRAFQNDPRRDRLLMLAGWRVIRFTYRDLNERPREVAGQLRLLLAA
jgi:hypothetical protein